MKRLLFILFGFVTSANAMSLSGNAVFTANDTVNDTIYVTRSIVIENYTAINTDVHVCSNCKVLIKNAAAFKANVYMADGAKIVQVISSNDQLKAIDVNVNYSVVIDNAKSVDFADVLNLSARGADKLTIKDSDVVIKSNLPSVSIPLELQGEVNIIVDNVDLFDNKPIVENISGSGIARVLVNNAGDFWTYDTYMDGGSLFLGMRRETDYNKAFGDNITSDFINDLRNDKKAEDLLKNLDATNDIDEFDKVLSQSARFNPDVLHMIPRLRHAMDMNRLYDTNSGVAFRPWGIMSSDFWGYGADFGVTWSKQDKFALSVTGRAGRVEYENNIEAFDALMYGANLYARYLFDYGVVLDMSFGAMKTDFDIGNVLYSGNKFYSPSTLSGYGMANVGYKIDIVNDLDFMPFVGVGAEAYKTENIDSGNIDVRAGVEILYGYNIFGVLYNYALNMTVDTNGDIGATGRVGFWANADMLGGDIAFSVVRVMDVTAYEMSVNAKFWF